MNIAVDEVSCRQFVERWYTASSAIVGRAGKDSRGDQPIVRVKARYMATDILPLHMYSRLTEVISLIYCITQILHLHMYSRLTEVNSLIYCITQ